MIKLSKKTAGYFVLFSAIISFPIHAAQAVCPVCTVAVGAGVGFTRYLGIEDTITGVWIGGLIMSLSFWTVGWFKKKNWKFPARKISITAGYFLLVVWPLFWLGIAGHPANQICGVDKLVFGIVFGAAGFVSGAAAHFKIKQKNNDRVYFPFQKVALSIAPLLILSLVFYIISKCS